MGSHDRAGVTRRTWKVALTLSRQLTTKEEDRLGELGMSLSYRNDNHDSIIVTNDVNATAALAVIHVCTLVEAAIQSPERSFDIVGVQAWDLERL